MTRILVCGGRDYADMESVQGALEGLGITLVSGQCLCSWCVEARLRAQEAAAQERRRVEAASRRLAARDRSGATCP